MSRNIARTFHSATRALIQFVGSPLEDVFVMNGSNGMEWRNSLQTVCTAVEKADSRIMVADVEGAVAHISSKDTHDPEHVITVGLKIQSGTRICSLHVHLDDTWSFFLSRAGREGGHSANIEKANLPGHVRNESTPQDGNHEGDQTR
ncbi:hypothetical protein PENSTE_c034G08223 [Penicillium steckii]|uniref:Uncharacterized protein n=1 Tax=Penicillium steckii TaxID=303698 RepID=A0A1V6SKS3_9EURO|nr:hypothetical protein PENSTE_c034G08223 [Penicillium steckii]